MPAVDTLMLSGLLSLPRPALGQDTMTPVPGDVILATTTSTADTGLLDSLAPLFLEQTGSP